MYVSKRGISMPKVSIIIPIYNVEHYVCKAVDSAINQTESDIEIILVDDGSTDNSGSVCDEYAYKDKRIKVIHKKNGGLSSSRNAGTTIATSNYVMYLDGDDYLKENAVERLLSVMKEYPSDVIQFRYQEVEEGQNPKIQEISKKVYQANTTKELFENLYHLGGEAASGCTKLIKRELMEAIPFENIRHEDEMWCTRAFQKNLTVTYIPDELYYYVMREGSIIHCNFNRKKMELFTVLKRRLDTLEKFELQDLMHYEYQRIFMSVLKLYHEAKIVDDKEAMVSIKKEYMNYKKEISSLGKLTGKFKLLSRLMRINFKAIDIYDTYCRLKHEVY